MYRTKQGSVDAAESTGCEAVRAARTGPQTVLPFLQKKWTTQKPTHCPPFGCLLHDTADNVQRVAND